MALERHPIGKLDVRGGLHQVPWKLPEGPAEPSRKLRQGELPGQGSGTILRVGRRGLRPAWSTRPPPPSSRGTHEVSHSTSPFSPQGGGGAGGCYVSSRAWMLGPSAPWLALGQLHPGWWEGCVRDAGGWGCTAASPGLRGHHGTGRESQIGSFVPVSWLWGSSGSSPLPAWASPCL